jgi:hypothetical protein
MQTVHNVGLLVFGSQHDDRHVETMASDHVAQLESVDPGEHNVQDDQIGLVLDHLGETLSAVRRDQCAKSIQLQAIPKNTEERRVIFHD